MSAPDHFVNVRLASLEAFRESSDGRTAVTMAATSASSPDPGRPVPGDDNGVVHAASRLMVLDHDGATIEPTRRLTSLAPLGRG
jgi:hypothetical protein